MASITDKIYDTAQQLGRFPHFIGTAQLTAGSGAPGAAAGPKGSLYLRTDGGANTTLYVREAAGAATDAAGVFTLAGIPVDTETVVIGGVTYTFVDTLAVAFDVLIGVSASATLDNLIAAINGSAGEGSTYGTGTTAHPTVTAAAGVGDTMDVTASTGGVAGNSIGTTTTAADGSWGSPTLTGGADDDGTGWAAK
jgi:hypothetical protein